MPTIQIENPLTECANIGNRTKEGKCREELGGEANCHAETCRVGGGAHLTHDRTRDALWAVLKTMGVQADREQQYPTLRPDGKPVTTVTADIVVSQAQKGQVFKRAIEIKTTANRSGSDPTHQKMELQKKFDCLKQALTQYGHTTEEAKAIIGSRELPQHVIPIVISSNGQIERRSRDWLKLLFTLLCPAPIRQGRICDPEWNPVKYMRKISLVTASAAATRVTQSLGAMTLRADKIKEDRRRGDTTGGCSARERDKWVEQEIKIDGDRAKSDEGDWQPHDPWREGWQTIEEGSAAEWWGEMPHQWHNEAEGRGEAKEQRRQGDAESDLMTGDMSDEINVRMASLIEESEDDEL